MLMLEGHEAKVRCVAYSPDGRWLASGDEAGVVICWDLTRGGEAFSRTSYTEQTEGIEETSVEAMTFSSDGEFLFEGCSNGDVAIEQLKMVSPPISRSPSTSAGAVSVLVLSPSGKELAVGGWNGELFFYDLTRHSTSPHQGNFSHGITGMSYFGRDDQYVVSTYQGRVLINPRRKSSETIAELRSLEPILRMACSSDNLLALGKSTGEITLWNPDEGGEPRNLQGHERPIYGLAFTPDGHHLLSAGADRTVRLWDVESESLMTTYEWHEKWVTCLAVSPDGMTAAAGSADHSVVVWDLADDL